MKTIRLVCLFSILFTSKTFSQITLETTYNAAGFSLYMVDLELSGMKYIKVSRNPGNRQIQLYNLDHSLWKSINCNNYPISFIAFDNNMDGIPDTTLNYEYDLLYVSENLFDLDPELEFIFTFNKSPFCPSYTGIYNEDGSIVFAGHGMFPGCRLNIPQQFRPIYNTPNGTKMILSTDDNNAKVYALSGTLTLPVSNNHSLAGEKLLNIYPNPTAGFTTIEYTLPVGSKSGIISVLDVNGTPVKNYNIDDTFDELHLESGEVSAGTYFYSLTVNGVKLETRKIVIL